MSVEHEFLLTIAAMKRDGELIDGDEFIMENDDAVETLCSLISDARRLTGQWCESCGEWVADLPAHEAEMTARGIR